MIGHFYKNGNLYVGEYVLCEDRKEENVSVQNKDDISLSVKNDKAKNELQDEKEISTKNEVRVDKESVGILFEGNGKYIKRDEIFVGKFENNNYRKGIWIKYKNIHNIFFYMNINEMIYKETYLDKMDQNINNNFTNIKNLLYFPLKEINVYIGEFENNMFNGLSLYYFYPFLYIGYFINNQMNGYGYIFYIPHLNYEDTEKNFFLKYNLYDFLFQKDQEQNKKCKSNIKGEKEKEKEKEKKEGKEKEEKEGKEKEEDKDKDKKGKEKEEKEEKEGKEKGYLPNNTSAENFQKNIFSKLEALMKQKYIRQNKKEIINGCIRKEEMCENKSHIIDKIEKEIYNNFQFRIRKKKKIKQLKEFFRKNENANFFNIFNYINYDNLLFKGYFYNNKFSNNLNEQALFKTRFVELYKNCIINKIERIKSELLGTTPKNSVDKLHISKELEFYLIEKKKKISLNKKKNEVKKELKSADETKKEIKFECLKNLVDDTLLKSIFELTTKSGNECVVKVITDQQLLKYKNKFNFFQTENKNIYEATINLNGCNQLVIINIILKNEINLSTNKENFQNVSKIKMYLISSDVSSIINYNLFCLHYIFVYVKSVDKKGKSRIVKKKK